MPAPQTRFDRYEIMSLLGRGGMGEVYRARDTQLDRIVALKLLPPGCTGDPDQLRRFALEAKAASSLNHPNILTIHDIGSAGGIHYIATELVEGQSLREAALHRRFTADDAITIAIQIASALDVAHKAGIIHRDVKPENIMLRPDGVAKLLDFGLAKLAGRAGMAAADGATVAHAGTSAGLILGTVRYMSPEQARGLEVDTRTDVFSLGAVLYELVAGRSPFDGETPSDLIASILQTDPPPLAHVVPDVSPDLEHIVRKALRKDRDERYQSVRDLLVDLKDLKKDLDVEARLERSGMRSDSAGLRGRQRSGVGLPPPAPRWRVRLPLAIAGVVVLSAATAGVWWYARSESRPTDDPALGASATVLQLTSEAGPELFPSLSSDGKSFVYAGRGRGSWDIYLQRVGGLNPTNLTADSAAEDTQPAMSPDGNHVAFRSERDGGGIFVMGATGESVRRVTDFGYNPAWSPDGRALVVATESVVQPSSRPTRSQLWTVDVATGARRRVTEGDALQPHWSPHGNRIAYWSRPGGSGQGDIWTINADGTSPVQVTNEPAMDWGAIWSPDGAHLFFSSDRGGSMDVWQVPVDERTGALRGAPAAVTLGSAAAVEHLSFSADGTRLAYVARTEMRNLKGVPFEPAAAQATGDAAPITRGSILVGFPDPSPDGQLLAYHSLGKQQDIFVARTDGTGMRQLTDDPQRDSWPRWSPDGKRIAFTSTRSGSSEIWSIGTDGSGLQQMTQTPGAHYPTWSPDGGQLAFSVHRPKNEAIIISVRAQPDSRGRPIAALPDPTLTFEVWSWSPDGRRLAGMRHLADGSHTGIGVYDTSSQSYEWLTNFGEWPVWLADGRRLLFTHQGRVHVVDSATKEHREVLNVAEADIGGASLAPDNRTIYFTYATTEADVWLMNLNRRR